MHTLLKGAQTIDTQPTQTIYAIFDRIEDAHSAIDDLRTSDVHAHDISLLMRDAAGNYAAFLNNGLQRADPAASTLRLNPHLAALNNTLTDFLTTYIPGVGGVTAAGPLARPLQRVFRGADGQQKGEIVGILVKAGVPEDNAPLYAEVLRRGGAVVGARTTTDTAERIGAILRGHHAIDIDARRQHYQAAGWDGFDPTADALSADDIAADRARLPEG